MKNIKWKNIAIIILSIIILIMLKNDNKKNLLIKEQEVKIELITEQAINNQIDNQRLTIENGQLKAEIKHLNKILEGYWTALKTATWRLETGNGTSRLWLENNNAGGIKCGSQYCKYDSQETGQKALDKLLRTYVQKYSFNIREIRYIYSGNTPNDFENFMLVFKEELRNEKVPFIKHFLE